MRFIDIKNKMMQAVVAKLTLLLVLGASLVSCDSDKIDYDLRGSGKLNLASLNNELNIELETKSAAIDLSSFLVVLKSASNGAVVGEYTYGKMPQIVELAAGGYVVEVKSHEPEAAAFEAPYYSDAQNFVIESNSVTNLAKMTCVLSNVRVSIGYDMTLKPLLGDDVEVNVSLSGATLKFAKNESRSGYFMLAEDQNVLTAVLTGEIDGEDVAYPIVLPNIKAGEHRQITFSVKNVVDNPDDGDAKFELIVDTACDGVDQDVDVDINEGVIEDEDDKEEPENPNPNVPITIEGDGFDISEEQYVPEEGLEIIVNIGASKGIANLFVEIDSETLTPDILSSVKLADKFDLANPGDLEEGLASLGFPVSEGVIGETSLVFNITDFTVLLGLYGPAKHNFHLKVVDAEGNELTKTLKLKND